MLIPFKDLFEKYAIKDCKRILHVGAHSGQEAQAYADLRVEHVTWIEADPRIYHKLLNHIGSFKNQVGVNACIADKDDKEVDFKIASNGGQSSSILEFGTHAKMHPDCTFVSHMTLKTVTLATLFKGGRLHSPYDLLNVDIQGAELLALKGLGSYLNDFKYLYLEINRDEVYKGCPLVEDIDFYVAPFGFRRVETLWASANLTWGDSFYTKGW